MYFNQTPMHCRTWGKMKWLDIQSVFSVCLTNDIGFLVERSDVCDLRFSVWLLKTIQFSPLNVSYLFACSCAGYRFQDFRCFSLACTACKVCNGYLIILKLKLFMLIQYDSLSTDYLPMWKCV